MISLNVMEPIIETPGRAEISPCDATEFTAQNLDRDKAGPGPCSDTACFPQEMSSGVAWGKERPAKTECPSLLVLVGLARFQQLESCPSEG